MKRKFKQWWTLQTEQSPLTLIYAHNKTTTCNVSNPGPDLGQAHKCVGVKLASEITTLPSCLLEADSQYIYMYKQIIFRKANRFVSTKNKMTTYYHTNEW